MIPAVNLRTVVSNGVVESSEFGISLNDTAHIMSILRDNIYTDKILAVLREYSSNAWDAHQQSGKSQTPIKVTLPTVMEPTLSIRDFGGGLSRNDVFEVYTKYGASTKRSSANTVGMLGVGCKSGFAYSDSFTIISSHAGVKSTYIAVLDKSDKGIISLMHEEPCGDETGVLIQIAIHPSDIYEFHRKARHFYKYFQPPPDINIEIPKLPTDQLNMVNGIIYNANNDESAVHNWVAIMGCVPYKINLDQLIGFEVDGVVGIPQFLSDISGALYFNIGDVQISASREELKYNNNTKTALVNKFNLLIEEYVSKSLEEIMTGNYSSWEKRIKGNNLYKLHIAIPEQLGSYVDERVKFKTDDIPKSISIWHDKEIAHSLSIHSLTRLIIRNDNRPLNGFKLQRNDYLIRRTDKNIAWSSIEDYVETLIKTLDIDGITVKKTSELVWVAPLSNASGRRINHKHSKRVFQLKVEINLHNGYFYFSRTNSDNWIVEDRVPTTNDLFVIINGFKSVGEDIYNNYREDIKLAKQFNINIPPVYGYKTSVKNPVENKDCLGIHYSDWRKTFIKDLLSPDVKNQIQIWGWCQLVNTTDYSNYNAKYQRSNYHKIIKALGKDHAVSKIITQYLKALKWVERTEKKTNINFMKNMELLYNRAGALMEELEANKTLVAAETKYPLLSLHSLSDIWGDHSDKWAHYFLSIDKTIGT